MTTDATCPYFHELSPTDSLSAALECRAGPRPLPLPLGYETRHCRSDGYRTCPRWLAVGAIQGQPTVTRQTWRRPGWQDLRALRSRRLHQANLVAAGRWMLAQARRNGLRAALGAAAGLGVALGLLAARGALEAAAAPLRGSNPAPAVRPVRAGPQIAQPREGPRRDADNAPVATATAIPSPSPAPTATAADPARPRLEVRVANPRPDPFGEQTVYVRLLLGDTPIRGADCRVDLAYRTVTHTYERRTLADGEFELDFPLQGATPGYTVQVTVECQTTTGVISGTTQFTPGG